MTATITIMRVLVLAVLLLPAGAAPNATMNATAPGFTEVFRDRFMEFLTEHPSVGTILTPTDPRHSMACKYLQNGHLVKLEPNYYCRSTYDHNPTCRCQSGTRRAASTFPSNRSWYDCHVVVMDLGSERLAWKQALEYSSNVTSSGKLELACGSTGQAYRGGVVWKVMVIGIFSAVVVTGIWTLLLLLAVDPIGPAAATGSSKGKASLVIVITISVLVRAWDGITDAWFLWGLVVSGSTRELLKVGLVMVTFMAVGMLVMAILMCALHTTCSVQRVGVSVLLVGCELCALILFAIVAHNVRTYLPDFIVSRDDLEFLYAIIVSFTVLAELILLVVGCTCHSHIAAVATTESTKGLRAAKVRFANDLVLLCCEGIPQLGVQASVFAWGATSTTVGTYIFSAVFSWLGVSLSLGTCILSAMWAVQHHKALAASPLPVRG